MQVQVSLTVPCVICCISCSPVPQNLLLLGLSTQRPWFSRSLCPSVSCELALGPQASLPPVANVCWVQARRGVSSCKRLLCLPCPHLLRSAPEGWGSGGPVFVGCTSALPWPRGSHNGALALLLLWESVLGGGSPSPWTGSRPREGAPVHRSGLDDAVDPGPAQTVLTASSRVAPLGDSSSNKRGAPYFSSALFRCWATECLAGSGQNLGALLAAAKPAHRGQSRRYCQMSLGASPGVFPAERDERGADGNCAGGRGDSRGRRCCDAQAQVAVACCLGLTPPPMTQGTRGRHMQIVWHCSRQRHPPGSRSCTCRHTMLLTSCRKWAPGAATGPAAPHAEDTGTPWLGDRVGDRRGILSDSLLPALVLGVT